MWLIEGHDSSANDRYRGSDAEENEHDLETQIAKEVAVLKRSKVEKRSVGDHDPLVFVSSDLW
jgi:tRNA acetyltransferase TAN1